MNYRRYPGFRMARVLVGDTVPRIALREMGDAARWPDLVSLNQMKPPYILPVGAPPEDGLLRPGDYIRLPSNRAYWNGSINEDDLYGRDLALNEGRLSVESGDLSIVAGRDNLRQALSHRIRTQPGEMLRHPKYGCHVRVVLGEKVRPLSAALGQGFVLRALREEPRLESVEALSVAVDGDILGVRASVIPVAENTPMDFNLVFPG